MASRGDKGGPGAGNTPRTATILWTGVGVWSESGLPLHEHATPVPGLQPPTTHTHPHTHTHTRTHTHTPTHPHTHIPTPPPPHTHTHTDVGLDTWLCCTLVVAVEGKFKLPKVNSAADLKKALTLLGSASPDTLLAFELLWTPQVRGGRGRERGLRGMAVREARSHGVWLFWLTWAALLGLGGGLVEVPLLQRRRAVPARPPRRLCPGYPSARLLVVPAPSPNLRNRPHRSRPRVTATARTSCWAISPPWRCCDRPVTKLGWALQLYLGWPSPA